MLLAYRRRLSNDAFRRSMIAVILYRENQCGASRDILDNILYQIAQDYFYINGKFKESVKFPKKWQLFFIYILNYDLKLGKIALLIKF